MSEDDARRLPISQRMNSLQLILSEFAVLVVRCCVLCYSVDAKCPVVKTDQPVFRYSENERSWFAELDQATIRRR